MGLHKVLLLVTFFVVINGNAQQAITKDTLILPSDTTSFSKTTKSLYEGTVQYDSNIESLVALQKENYRKQKRAAIIRIALGLGFLGVLIAGLLRRRKKDSTSSR